MTQYQIAYNLKEAAKLGAALGKMLRAGDVILLNGDLGAGKTTLARGILLQPPDIAKYRFAVGTL